MLLVIALLQSHLHEHQQRRRVAVIFAFIGLHLSFLSPLIVVVGVRAEGKAGLATPTIG